MVCPAANERQFFGSASTLPPFPASFIITSAQPLSARSLGIRRTAQWRIFAENGAE
jgi:hypothetical protein